MRIFRSLGDLGRGSRPAAVAIGNFDGLHLGHQKILRCLIQAAREENLSPMVLTFSPHPEKILGRGRLAMIQTLGQRLAGIRESGVRAAVVMPFNRSFASLSKTEFARQVLVEALHAKKVVVGRNFRFGRRQEGRVADLIRLGRDLGFSVLPIPPVVRQGTPVSSSRIRSLLLRGKIPQANALLGRPYEIEGCVVHGSARGKTLGFPTANVLSRNEILPRGVFVTESLIGRRCYPSLTNIGRRPTFGRSGLQVESHLIGFRGNAYGKTLRIRFLGKLREEKRFSSPQALAVQIKADIDAARGYFVRRH